MHRYVVVDAFADRPLAGNPVAVFFGANGMSDELMQGVAQEMHLSEVTFVLPARGSGDFRVRIFTPVNELPFAGHPILGTAVALARIDGRRELLLETEMDVIRCEIEHFSAHSTVRMRQPVATWEPFPEQEELLAALGVTASGPPVEIYRNGPRHVFVGVRDVAALSALRPDHRALARFPDMAANCFAGQGRTWRTRMFSPAYGVVEDAATGSAAGPLAIHLARHGLAAYGDELEITQGVEIGRASRMRATATAVGDRVEEVWVAGDGAVAAQGTIFV